ncbi:MAG TPA: AMP-binding protein [Acidimicrobiia bacterium]|nr:AMP-binding protein [Acidimicrobiia bacterium]
MNSPGGSLPVDVVTSPERRAAFVASGAWDGTTLAGRVRRHATAAGTAPAVIDGPGGRVHAYAELDGDADRVAGHLRSLGVEPGDVVSVQLPNWYETVAIDLAVLRIGAVLNPLLPVYRANELRHMLAVGAVRVLFTPGTYRGFDHRAMVEGLRPALPALEHHVTIDPGGGLPGARTDPSSDPGGGPPPPGDPAAVSELLFTSGTEATPKAIMHTEQTTGAAVRTAARDLGLGRSDVVWMPSPIGHSTGLNYGVRMALHHGLPLVLQDRWSPEDAVILVSTHRCTYTVAATTFLADFVEAARNRRADVSSLRLFGSGGAPVPAELVTAAGAVGVNVLRLYGSTEVLVATWNRPDDPLDRRVMTDGRPLGGVEVEVRAGDGRAVVGEPGEIYVRSPATAVGFHADPVRTAATFGPGGWVRSGDLGVLGSDGHLAIVGRRKEIIIRGGLNIAPRELEDLIGALPGVAAVAVVGVPDDRLGELTCACVVPAPGAAPPTLEGIVAALREKGLASYKLPQRLELVAALPTTATGKIQKFRLRSDIRERDSSPR